MVLLTVEIAPYFFCAEWIAGDSGASSFRLLLFAWAHKFICLVGVWPSYVTCLLFTLFFIFALSVFVSLTLCAGLILLPDFAVNS